MNWNLCWSLKSVVHCGQKARMRKAAPTRVYVRLRMERNRTTDTEARYNLRRSTFCLKLVTTPRTSHIESRAWLRRLSGCGGWIGIEVEGSMLADL